jgi:hypothetical protein
MKNTYKKNENMEEIIEKLKSLETDKISFYSYLKNVLLQHEPFGELSEIKKIYPTEVRELCLEIMEDSIQSTDSVVGMLENTDPRTQIFEEISINLRKLSDIYKK